MVRVLVCCVAFILLFVLFETVTQSTFILKISDFLNNYFSQFYYLPLMKNVK